MLNMLNIGYVNSGIKKIKSKDSFWWTEIMSKGRQGDGIMNEYQKLLGFEIIAVNY